MFHILGFFLAIVLVVGIIIASFAGWVLRTIFGVGSGRSSQHTNRRTHNQQQSYQNSSRPDDKEDVRTEGSSQPPRKKIFTEDEGEYVDFEEIK